jgi:chromosome segregation ATPase
MESFRDDSAAQLRQHGELVSQNDDTRRQLSAFEGMLNAANARIVALCDELPKLQQVVARIHERLDGVDRTVLAFQHEAEKERQWRQTVDEQRTRTRECLAWLRDEFVRMQGLIQGLTHEVAELRAASSVSAVRSTSGTVDAKSVLDMVQPELNRLVDQAIARTRHDMSSLPTWEQVREFTDQRFRESTTRLEAIVEQDSRMRAAERESMVRGFHASLSRERECSVVPRETASHIGYRRVFGRNGRRTTPTARVSGRRYAPGA